MSVAEYIDYDFSLDGILFSMPIYNQILAEAVAHVKEPGFKAETYFCSHPDIEVSKLATHLAIDRHQLGGRFVIQEREGSLRQRVEHIVLDYRREIIEASMKDLQQQIRQAAGNNEKIIELMKQLKEMQEIRNTIAKKLGTEIVF